jgi:hypothetical protein
MCPELVEGRDLDLLPALRVWPPAPHSSGEDQLLAAVRNFRNRLPLIDHKLIVDAEATDLAGEYCSSSLAILLNRSLQLSPGEAAARVRAAAALGPSFSSLGEAVEPALPSLWRRNAPVR